jgi:hypothetical protein
VKENLPGFLSRALFLAKCASTSGKALVRRWDTRNDAVKAFTLHEVSMIGAGSGGRLSAEVDEILVLGVCEVIPCTKQGEKALREAPEWKK